MRIALPPVVFQFIIPFSCTIKLPPNGGIDAAVHSKGMKAERCHYRPRLVHGDQLRFLAE
jgi:hypothetical protein